MDAGDGDVGVVAPDGAAEGFGEKFRVFCGAYEEVGGVGRIVGEGKVDHIDGRGVERVTVRVGDYANYCHWFAVVQELTSEGVAIGPDGPGCAVGDDGVFRVRSCSSRARPWRMVWRRVAK